MRKIKIKPHYHGVYAAVCIALLGLSLPLQAASNGNRLLEEVVVTAQKRSENSQDVPIAINAFSGEVLDARGITDPLDLPLATPGLTVNEQAGYSVTYLRGVGSDAYLLADPSVATYIDGVYYPFAHGAAQAFGATERIEVLKGPQGTLFGRNAVGGAIHVITKDPYFDEFYGSVSTSVADYNGNRAVESKFHVNLPITDYLAIGVSGLYNEADDWREGTIAGKETPIDRTRGGRIKLRFAPTDYLDITLAAFKLNQDGVGTMFATNGDVSPNFQNLIEEQSREDGSVDTPAYFTLENEVYYGTLNLFTDWFDVKVIASDQLVGTGAKYDFDGSPTPLVGFEIGKQGADVQTAELQLLSNETSWHSEKMDWILGYYYFTSVAGMDEILFGVSESLIGAASPVGGLVNILNQITDLVGGTSFNASEPIFAFGLLETDSESIFAQVNYQFNDWLGLIVGLRQQEETRTLLESGGSLILPTGPAEYARYGGQSDTTRSLSPKVSLQLTPWEDTLIYMSYQEAVKSSTYNVVNFLNFEEPEPVKAEELIAYEIGIKQTLFNGTTTLAAAAFYYDITNIQVQFLSLFAGGAVTFENAPAAEIMGADFDITALLFPELWSGLVLTLGGAYLDTEFTEFPSGQGFNEGDRTYTDSKNLTGKQIPRSPRWSGTIGLIQTFQFDNSSLELATDYYYNSGFFYLAENSDFSEEPEYAVMGARISYHYEPYDLRLTAFGKNITDEEYNYSKFTNDFGALDATAPPASYGVRLQWNF